MPGLRRLASQRWHCWPPTHLSEPTSTARPTRTRYERTRPGRQNHRGQHRFPSDRKREDAEPESRASRRPRAERAGRARSEDRPEPRDRNTTRDETMGMSGRDLRGDRDMRERPARTDNTSTTRPHERPLPGRRLRFGVVDESAFRPPQGPGRPHASTSRRTPAPRQLHSGRARRCTLTGWSRGGLTI
jgi:hypothetical protein